MIRAEILREIAPLLEGQLVVCNIGIPSQELHAIADQPSNFYMLGTMGLASSIGLGLALVQDKPVVVIDGDGSVLTNLGTLPTIGNNDAGHLILLIIDNGSYGSTGDQPTYTGKRTSLAAMARAAGCRNVVEVMDRDCASALSKALSTRETTVVVCKCDSGNEVMPVIALDPVTIRDRFMRTVQI